MYTLDANILLRDLDTRSPEYALCHALLEQLQQRGTPLVEPLIVLAEVAGSASRELRDPIRGRIAAAALRSFPHSTFVTIDGTLAEEAAELAADYALRGMDAIYVAVARQYGCARVTLDAEIEQRVGSVVTVQTPAAVLAQWANGNTTD